MPVTGVSPRFSNGGMATRRTPISSSSPTTTPLKATVAVYNPISNDESWEIINDCESLPYLFLRL